MALKSFKERSLRSIQNSRTLVLITVYNERGRVPDLLQAINSQDKPVQGVLIVDNSWKPVFANLSELHSLQAGLEITVWHKPENLGVSGAIARAISFAKENGYQFLWLMDHDSIPSPSCHLQLHRTLEMNSDIALAACQPVIEPNGTFLCGLIFQNYRFVPRKLSEANGWIQQYECDAVITSGSLLSIDKVGDLGIVDESLFIDAVDHDMCLRIRSAGYKVVVVKEAVMSHQLGAYKEVRDRFKNRMIQLSSYSNLRLYYICRNHTYIEIRAARGFWKLVSVLWRIRFCLWQIKMNFLEGDNAARKSVYCLWGLLHGLLGRTGKHPLSYPKISDAKPV